jgi:AraC-like DNA-binding protein/ABC-type Fe3+-hydroxamate transport system substrate-binding protein
MFLKKQNVYKQGHLYTYYRIVESYRDEQGKNKHRTIQYLGKLSDEEVITMKQQLKDNVYPTLDHSPPSHTTFKQQTYSLSSQVWVPLSLTVITYQPDHRKEWTVAEQDTLLFIKEGQAEVYIQGNRLMLTADQVLFSPQGSGVFLHNTFSQPLQLFKLVFKNTHPSASSFFAPDHLPYMISIRSPLEVQRLCREWLELVTEQPLFSAEKELYSQYLFYQLLHLIWTYQPLPTEQNNSNIVQQAIDYVKSHYREEIRRDVIAAQLGITPEHFSRIFRKHKQISFSDYVYHWRMNAAKKDIQYSSTSLREIARRNGYPNEHYFSRRFKQLFGVSPKQYQSTLKNYAAWNYPLTAMLLHLGIVPQAGYLEPWKWEVYRQHMNIDTMTLLHESLEQSIETMTNLQPDLVFAYEDNIGKSILEDHVPVQAISIETYDWRQQWLWLAEQVGKLEQAWHWLNTWDQQIQLAKAQLLPFIADHQTVGIYKIVSEKIYVYGDRRSMGGPLIYQELHHTPPQIIKEKIIDQQRINLEISLTELDQYAADHMIVIHYPIEGTAELSTKSIMESTEWQQLEAVRNQQVYKMDRNIFYGFDPCSLEAQLQLWLKQFIS